MSGFVPNFEHSRVHKTRLRLALEYTISLLVGGHQSDTRLATRGTANGENDGQQRCQDHDTLDDGRMRWMMVLHGAEISAGLLVERVI
jgi:hypothetical protein